MKIAIITWASIGMATKQGVSNISSSSTTMLMLMLMPILINANANNNTSTDIIIF